MLEIKTILVPMDFSNHSEKALACALDLARTYRAKVHLLHCYGVDMLLAVPYDPPYPTALPAEFEERTKTAAQAKLASFERQVAAAGLAAASHLSTLFPSDAIVRTAEQIGADLVVMGTRGLTGLKHVLLGSVAERTIRTAPCPVLTVKVEHDTARD